MKKQKQVNKKQTKAQIIKPDEIKKILLDSTLVENFIGHAESLPILKTQHIADLENLKIQLADNKFNRETYKTRVKELKEVYHEKVKNIKYIDYCFKKNYMNMIHRIKDQEQIKKVSQNFTIIHEMLCCLGDHNTKYFKHDMLEYDKMPYKPILFVRNLTKFYSGKDQPNIDCLNFNVFPGEFHAFIGANGAGKTTTIKSLITSYYNWSGTILINGIKNLTENAKKKIGYIPEKASFPENFSTYNYLKWMVMLSGLNTKDAETIVEKQLREIGMWNMRNRSPNTFSSGQKKKVLLLQTLIHNPDIIIMDEPVANLDPKARIDFFDKLLQLKRQKKAIFISSHVLAELDMYADALTILDGGKIVYSGKKQTLLDKYNTNDYTLSFDKANKTKVLKYLKSLKLKPERIDEKENLYKFKITNPKLIAKIQTFLARNRIVMQSFSKQEPSLEDIYRQLIVYGSKDTMAENIAAGKTEGMTAVEHKKKIY